MAWNGVGATSGIHKGSRPVSSLPPRHEPGALTREQRHALEGQAAAYALNALEADEAAQFEQHLATCGLCRQLVAEAVTVVSHLPSLVRPEETSQALRERVVAAARGQTEEPTAAEPQPAAAAAGRRAAGLRRPWWQRLRSRGEPALEWAAAALLLCTLGLGTWNVSLRQQAQAQAARAAEYEAVLEAAAGGQVVTLMPASAAAPRNARAALIIPPAGSGEAPRLVVSHLEPPATDRSYQLWLIDGQTPRDAGVFRSRGAAAEIVPVHGDPRRASAAAITIEPAGGSRAPTAPPILAAPLPPP